MAALPPRGPRRVAAFFAVVSLALLTGCVQLPDLDEAMRTAGSVPETSFVYDADGTLITRLHAEENRETIPLDQVPVVMRNAVIAIEDQRFYDHPGVDLRAIIRAFFRNTNEGRVVEGGSTITQQYVKNVLVERTKTLKRKVTEAALAYQLEKRYNKDQILERYLNTVYFGQGAYGIEAAAKTFFGVNARDLTLPQSALLAGLIKSPARYDPLVDEQAALGRRDLVLREMRQLEFITADEEAAAITTPLDVRPKQGLQRYEAGYFVEWVKGLIERDPAFNALGTTLAERINALFKGGLRIHTTVDLSMQRIAEASSKQVLDRDKDPYNGFVAVDPDTGAVRAMVGGRDFFDANDPYAKFNLAVQSRRQPGSSFKPFTLAAALEKGIPLSRMYRGGSQVTIRLPGGEVWSPRNYESLSFGASLSVREATIKSVNVVYAQLARDIGAEAVVEMAQRLGITSELKPYLAISLGAQEVSPLEMAVAYSAFANGGYRVNPHGITKITDAAGKVLYEWKPTKTRALKPRIVDQVNRALQDVIRYGTGRRERLPDRPAAGKTGTSDEYHDAWFAGYVRQMVAVSWIGFPKAQIPMTPPYTRIRVVGGSWPGQIWKLFMTNALKDQPSLPFEEGGGDGDLVSVRIDVTRNCKPNRFTPPNAIESVQFERGTEPTTVCTEPTSPVIATVPNVVGRAEADAKAILEEAGFYAKSVQSACETYPPGVVCSQTPAPGTTGTAGTTVSLIVANDAVETVVPNVLGLTRSTALARLQDAGFDVDYVFAANGTTSPSGCSDGSVGGADRVWAQSRCAGEQVPRGSRIVIYVNPIG
ncbi:MAG TPA: PBP1A family penicillin-binding protein [Actinomycetota bacterium]